MRDIEIRQIRYFVAVAKELHFGKAAAELNITQPALSQQIASLEEELGLTLFERDRRHVSLTAAGSLFYDKSLEILALLDSVSSTMKKLSDKKREGMSLGLVEHAYLPFLVPAIAAMQKLHPNIKFKQREMTSNLQIRALSAKEIDIGIGLILKKSQLSKVCFRPIIHGSWGLLVRKDHRFAKRKAVTLKDLEDEGLITFPRGLNPSLYDLVMECFAKADVTPNVIYETTQAHAGMRMVENGSGIMLTPNYFLLDTVTDTVFVPLTGLPPLKVCVFWRKNESSPLILDFAKCLTEAAAFVEKRKASRVEASPIQMI